MLKISKSRIENHLHQLCYIHLFDVWIPHKWKNFLTMFLHAILYLNIMKMFHFLKQILTNDEKWILYKNVKWKKSWGKWNGTNTYNTKGQSSSKECDVVYVVELEGSPLVWVPSEKLNDYFQQALLPVRLLECSTRQ